MAENVQLDGQDADHIARVLTNLANLVDPATNTQQPLNERQLYVLAGGISIARDPGQWAEVLRRHAETIYQQRGEDGARL
ncbi:hypothetical protein [Streptomyces silvisoli]|uniref:Uncharacterized protein n=1 Tax=Streptomyces silvisoli TaxID=3034235 RepID=A0ABT5ZG58_9ACTN|nr:hypothetical protein [Streptomyces silvisoli]MDF3288808.1 hypothetical protein [Streptomyces silvisoli]